MELQQPVVTPQGDLPRVRLFVARRAARHFRASRMNWLSRTAPRRMGASKVPICGTTRSRPSSSRQRKTSRTGGAADGVLFGEPGFRQALTGPHPAAGDVRVQTLMQPVALGLCGLEPVHLGSSHAPRGLGRRALFPRIGISSLCRRAPHGRHLVFLCTRRPASDAGQEQGERLAVCLARNHIGAKSPPMPGAGARDSGYATE